MQIFNRRITQYLLIWKNKYPRKPLIIRGARQVGKTSIILLFAQKHFPNLIHLNLEKYEHNQHFKEDLSLQMFEQIINAIFQQKLIPGETLLFIDEIQNSPALIKLLRFFYEEKPELHVIATGSLLQAKIEKEGWSMPVGRIEYVYLYPLDFFEYLEAKEELELLNFLKSVPLKNNQIPPAIHQHSLKLFYDYAIIGGMPEIIQKSHEKQSRSELKTVYSSLFTAYTEDIYKYASQADIKYISYVLEQSPLFAGTAITYEKFGGGNFRSREMGQAFHLLQKVMLLHQCQATKSINAPLTPQRKRPKKLLFLDAGLINYKTNILDNLIHFQNLNEIYRGRIAEQIVGQNIISQFTNSTPNLFYWAQDKSKSRAEIDFCFSQGETIIGVEVKSGLSSRLRSLHEFASNVKNSKLIRVYNENIKKEQIKIKNKKFSLTSLPFYLCPRILENS